MPYTACKLVTFEVGIGYLHRYVAAQRARQLRHGREVAAPPRKAIVLAVYKQDIAERQRHIVAMRLHTDKLGDVHALVEQVACSRSAKAAPEIVAQGCALAWFALALARSC